MVSNAQVRQPGGLVASRGDYVRKIILELQRSLYFFYSHPKMPHKTVRVSRPDSNGPVGWQGTWQARSPRRHSPWPGVSCLGGRLSLSFLQVLALGSRSCTEVRWFVTKSEQVIYVLVELRRSSLKHT